MAQITNVSACNVKQKQISPLISIGACTRSNSPRLHWYKQVNVSISKTILQQKTFRRSKHRHIVTPVEEGNQPCLWFSWASGRQVCELEFIPILISFFLFHTDATPLPVWQTSHAGNLHILHWLTLGALMGVNYIAFQVFHHTTA